MPKPKNVLITGVRRGIGEAIAQRLADEGWNVLGIDREKPNHFVGEFLQLDLSADHFRKAVCDFLDQQGVSSLEGLVNNAGICVSKPVTEITETDWDQTFHVNVRAPFFLTQYLKDYLKSGMGSVVNISSVHAFATTPGMSAYAGSKAALLGVTRAMAVEWGSLGIRVNGIVPGAIDTPMLRAGLKDQKAKESFLLERTPLGKIGTGDQIAQAVQFLLSNQSQFMTGHAFVVDGGALSRLSTE